MKNPLPLVFTSLQRLVATLHGLSRTIFGELKWCPPGWIEQTTVRLRQISPQRRNLLLRISAAALLGLILFYRLAFVNDENGIVAAALPPEASEITAQGLVPSPLNVEFSKSALKMELIDKTVNQKVKLSPDVAGTWTCTGDNRLVFQPKSDWPAGCEFRVTLSDSLLARGIQLSKNIIRFKTAPLTARIDELKFYIDPKNPKTREITASLNFNYPVEAGSLEKSVRLASPVLDTLFLRTGNQADFRVDVTDFGRKAWFRTLPVQLPGSPSFMDIEIRRGLKPLSGTAMTAAVRQRFLIPDLYSFLKIISSTCCITRKTSGDPEQTLVLQTTVGVKPQVLQKKLSLYLLPRNKPARGIDPDVRDYNWSSPAEIDDAILGVSEKISPKFNSADLDYPELNSATLDLPPGRFLYVRVDGGLEGLGGFILKQPCSNIVKVPGYPQEVRIMHDGSVLSQSGERKLSILTRGVDCIEYRLGRVSPDQINHLVSQSDGNFQNPIFRNYNFGEDNLSRVTYKTVQINDSQNGRAGYLAFDFKTMLQGQDVEPRGLFFLEVSNQSGESTPKRLAAEGPDPSPNQGGWTNQRSDNPLTDRRFILITDLGILVKDNADGTQDIFVQSVKTGRPVPDARVQVIGKNGQPVAEAVTGAEGRAALPRVMDLKREKRPVAFLVTRDGDLSFLPYNRADRKLNFSRYDVGGLQLKDPACLSTFLFTERGLYRPGDTVYAGMVAKQYNWLGNLEGVPLELELVNPRDVAVHTQKIQLPRDGFLTLTCSTTEGAPTGTYALSAYVLNQDGERGEMLGCTTFRVEEFLPDRMKIKAALTRQNKAGWVQPQDLRIAIDLQNLYGTPAAGHRISGDITLVPASYTFDRYPDHVFFDPDLATHKKTGVQEEQLPEIKTDDSGRALLELNLQRFEKGVYQLNYLVRGFEQEGGRSVAAGGGAMVSAREFLVGCKPDGDLKYLRMNSRHKVEFLAVNPDLEPRSIAGLQIKLSEQQYVSVLSKTANGSYAYQSVLKENSLGSQPVSLGRDGFVYDLPTSRPGDFVARLVDANDVCVAVTRFSVAGNANLSRSLEKNAELKLKLSRAEYKPGEEIQLSVTAPYTGTGLITIERDRVYASKWFQTSSTSSTQSIKLPADLEGNAYVTVTFVRSLDSKEIYTSPLSCAVAPFSIDHSRRRAGIELNTPAKARPGHPFVIHFKTDRPGRAVVYAVDEGILQVAHYSTPDPLEHFFEKRALQVGTSQILDLILPEYSIVRQEAAPGGDGDDLLASGLNPFKRKSEPPVVFWSGIIDATGKEQTLTYNVPDYFNGTLRVMALVVRNDAVNSTETRSVLQSPLVLQPNIPAFIAPNDEFVVTVPVANNVENSGPAATVKLALTSGAGLTVLEQPESSLPIAEGKDAVFHCKLKAGDMLGNQDLIFAASLGGETTGYTSHVSLRPASPCLTRIRSGYFKTARLEVPRERDLYDQFRQLQVSASLLPFGFAAGLKVYLDEYPHLCTEQLTSRAFASLLLPPEKGEDAQDAVRDRAMSLILNVLCTRQNDQGAFGLWRPDKDLHFDFPSVYAMHFLTEAREHGRDIPSDLMQRGLSHLEDMAGETPADLTAARQQACAIYLLTRNRKITTNYLDALTSWLEQNQQGIWQNDPAGLYCAASYALLHNAKDARRIFDAFKLQDHPRQKSQDDYYTDLGRDSQYLYILARHFPDLISRVKPEDLERLADRIAKDEFNTHAAAYAILGLQAYCEAAHETGTSVAAVDEKLGNGTNRAIQLSKGVCPVASFSPDARSLVFKNPGSRPLFYQVMETGFDRKAEQKTLEQGLEVTREYQNRLGKTVQSAVQGEELSVHVRLRSTSGDNVQNVAVLDLLPGGFEVVTESLRTDHEEDNQSGDRDGFVPDYLDVREDRVVIYGTAESHAQEFVYKIRATNRGTYRIPPVQAQSMYKKSLQARGTSGNMTVD